MTAYSEFRIRIEPGPRKGQYRVEATGLGGDRTGAFKVPYSSAELENFVLKVGRTRRGVRKIASPEWDMAKTFGGRLFSSLIQGPVGELYRTSYSMAQATGDGLRITLSLTDSPELAEIPWEYLFDAPNFLAISTSTPVVRYLDVAKPRRPLQIELPIRILGVVSAPSDAEELKTDDERSRLESALKPLVDANAVSIDWLEEATLVALTKKMRPDTYHILHFIGHGGFDDSSGEGALLFEDETGRGRSVSGEQLATVLNNKVALRLVFLNSCEGARTSVKDPFSGVAASLIQREIPAVIAMQFEITDRAAIIFASEFYTMLAEGQPVDTSVTQARLTVFADQNDVEWGTPVLFMRVADGQLFNVEHAPALPRVAPEDLPPKAETRNGPAVPIAMAAAGALGAAPAGAAAVEAGTAVEPAPPGETGESGTSIESEPPGGPIVGSATAIGSAPAAEPAIEGDATAESPPAVETEAGTHAPAAWSAPSEPAAEGEATVGAMPAGRAVAAEAAVETGARPNPRPSWRPRSPACTRRSSRRSSSRRHPASRRHPSRRHRPSPRLDGRRPSPSRPRRERPSRNRPSSRRSPPSRSSNPNRSPSRNQACSPASRSGSLP